MDTAMNCHRNSIEDSLSRLIFRIRDTLNRLTRLWDEVQMDDAARATRVECAYLHFYTLLEDIVKSEEDMVQGVRSDIEARRIAISDLREMLKMPKFNEAFYPENSIALLKALDDELNILMKKRDDTVDEQMNEYKALKELCDRLNSTSSFDYEAIKTNILSPNVLQKLKGERKRLAIKVEERIELATKIQTECRKMYKSLKETISCTGEQQNLLNIDFNTSFMSLGDDTVQNLKKLQSFMLDAHNVWFEHISFQYSESLIAFREFSEKCCMEYQHLPYPEFFEHGIQIWTILETQDQSTIDKLEAEVNELKRRYGIGKTVFEAFRKWRQLWQEKINREQEASNLQFYNNRGGQLNAFLKRQRQLVALVPQALDELKIVIRRFLDDGGDCNDIIIDEISPDEYAEFLMSEYKEQKELHRTLKASSITLRGRRMSGKVKVPSGKIARRKLSIRHKLSIISPVKTTNKLRPIGMLGSIAVILRLDFGGPKTSSPKLLFPKKTLLNEVGTTPIVASAIAIGSHSRSRLPCKVPRSVPNQLHRIGEQTYYYGTSTPLTSKMREPLRKIDDNLLKTPVSHWRY